jgi:ABC-type multidrug transport system permease subunit
LPKWIQPIRFFSVVGFAMEGWRAVQVDGAGVAGVLVPAGALFALAAVFFGIGLWRMQVSR